MQTRSGVRGRPPPKRWVFLCSGRSGAMACQRSSGMRQSSGMGRSSMAESPQNANRQDTSADGL